jgi:aryl-alcohol dehydrogenase-like predicted oxidoreductase
MDRIRLAGEMPVHRVGLGTNRLQTLGDGATAFLHAAIEAGVDFIDTADVYGNTASERRIGEAFPERVPGLTIATKGGMIRHADGALGADGRPDHLRSALEASLRRLRRDSIDLYQLHRPDPSVPFEESVRTLAQLRKEGKIRHVGLSNVTVAQFESARRIVPIASVQNEYSVLDRRSEPVLAACERAGVAFLPWFPLSKGSVASNAVLQRTATALGAAPTQVALAWLLHRSPVILPIPGSTNAGHVRENMASLRLALDPAAIAALDGIAPPPSAA